MSALSQTDLQPQTDQSQHSIGMLELEITGKCQLTCTHCFPGSSPQGTTGAMSVADWLAVIDDAPAAGFQMIQFIGGEPTTHPALPLFIERALGHGLRVEVFTNLFKITDKMWEALDQSGVSVATSFYSANAEQHYAITSKPGSFHRTIDNIKLVLARGIPLRVGMVQLDEMQDVDGGKQLLVDLGVDPARIHVDHLRAIGRAADDAGGSDDLLDQLCGLCGNGRAAVMPDGAVSPCVMSRHLVTGNVIGSSLTEVIQGEGFTGQRSMLVSYFGATRRSDCNPACDPGWIADAADCNPACDPGWVAQLAGKCGPVGSCGPVCGPGKAEVLPTNGTSACGPNGVDNPPVTAVPIPVTIGVPTGV